MKRILAFIFIVTTLSSCLMISVSAKEVEYSASSGYEYNADSVSVAAPVTYTYSKSADQKSMGLDAPLIEPQDFYYTENTLYVLDSGNSRIIELDENYTVKKIHDMFVSENGESVSFTGAKGFTVDGDGNFYIADTENMRILIADRNDKIIKIISKNENVTVGYDYTFDVSKILINKQGMIYAIVKSVNDGAFVFDSEGNFQHFFGRNQVAKTTDVILYYLKKKFLTREQLLKSKSSTATTISNFDIDEKGFVYTISQSADSTGASSVNKVNFKGTNVFETMGVISTFGDLEWDRKSVESKYTSFSDVDIDDEGFINLLDTGRGKVFQYTSDGQLIGTFGAYGEQLGTFYEPVAIESVKNKVVVLDKNGSIIEFVPTEYAECLRTAFIDLDTSDPELGIEQWNKVLKLNSNSLYPYYGLGIAYEKLGEYKTAMDCFKKASAQSEYSDAFYEYRKQLISENLGYILLVVATVIICLSIVVAVLKKKILKSSNLAFSVFESKYLFPVYTLFHPADGFEQFKYRKELPSEKLSVGIIGVMFLVNVFKYFFTGYAFNNNDPEDYSILSTLISSVIVYALFIIGNWAVCSLFNGNGTLKEISVVTAYSLIPYIISQLLCVGLSNVLTLDETVALTIVTLIGVIWSGIVLLIGLASVNQYYLGKTILTVLLTLFAIVVLAVLVFLFFSLMQQLVYFVNSIWEEYQLL